MAVRVSSRSTDLVSAAHNLLFLFLIYEEYREFLVHLRRISTFYVALSPDFHMFLFPLSFGSVTSCLNSRIILEFSPFSLWCLFSSRLSRRLHAKPVFRFFSWKFLPSVPFRPYLLVALGFTWSWCYNPLCWYFA